MNARICNIQKFCTHDGDGIRTTVFFAGCPLSCRWCHNPEGKNGDRQLLFHKEKCIGCGRCLATGCGAQVFMPTRTIDREKCTACGRCVDLCPAKAVERSFYEASIDDILSVVRQDRVFYGDIGGMTLSGGEPLYQPEAALALLRAAKAEGIGTALETSGVFDPTYIPALTETVDLFLWDYKDSDPARFHENTGGQLAPIERNLRQADALGARIRLRCLLIRGVNTTDAHATAIRDLAASLRGIDGIDLIPYHPMGQSKYEQLGLPDTFDTADKVPTADELARFRTVLSPWMTVHK